MRPRFLQHTSCAAWHRCALDRLGGRHLKHGSSTSPPAPDDAVPVSPRLSRRHVKSCPKYTSVALYTVMLHNWPGDPPASHTISVLSENPTSLTAASCNHALLSGARAEFTTAHVVVTAAPVPLRAALRHGGLQQPRGWSCLVSDTSPVAQYTRSRRGCLPDAWSISHVWTNRRSVSQPPVESAVSMPDTPQFASLTLLVR